MRGFGGSTSSHLFGVPFWARDRAMILSGLDARFASELERDQFLDGIVNRITDKSAALLQTVSLFGAVAAYLFDKKNLPVLPAGLHADSAALYPLAFLTLSALLLALNLGMYWPRITFTPGPDLDSQKQAWRLAMVGAIQARSIRLTIAMWLLLASLPAAIYDGAIAAAQARAVWDWVLAALYSAGR